MYNIKYIDIYYYFTVYMNNISQHPKPGIKLIIINLKKIYFENRSLHI